MLKIKNLETNTTKCFQLPADPLLSPVPACLTTDSLNQNAQGCVIRRMECDSDFVDFGSMVEFDYDSSKQVRNGKFDVVVVLTCNGTGDGWVFTPNRPETDWGSNTTVVHVAQCFGPTCQNTGDC
ncbi:unnamed protein product, partial [Mesorhabditis belari]|uniref:Uncharacterized protein n=1 Tax=Mesorhabditis belari TaxID=2138241 RepID=A0AAF3F0F0_9BILA